MAKWWGKNISGRDVRSCSKFAVPWCRFWSSPTIRCQYASDQMYWTIKVLNAVLLPTGGGSPETEWQLLAENGTNKHRVFGGLRGMQCGRLAVRWFADVTHSLATTTKPVGGNGRDAAVDRDCRQSRYRRRCRRNIHRNTWKPCRSQSDGANMLKLILGRAGN